MKKWKKKNSYSARRIFAAVVIWFILTGVLVNLDNRFQLSAKTVAFALVGVFVPIICAVLVLFFGFEWLKKGFKAHKNGLPYPSPVKSGTTYTPTETVEINDLVQSFGYSANRVTDEIYKEQEIVHTSRACNPLPSTGDKMFDSAIEIIMDTGQASPSVLQRKLKIGYGQAARIIDEIEECGIVGPFQGSKPRDILVDRKQCAELIEYINVKKETKRKEERLEKAIREVGLNSNLDLSECDPMRVIISMEKNLEYKYKSFIFNACSPDDGKREFNMFRDNCASSKLPLAAEVRLVSLIEEYEPKFSVPNPMYAVDQMEGHAFEHWCAELLKKNGFTKVEVTKGSGDQGVDVLATKDGIKYAIQCKCYSSDLGNKPVQEVHAGKAMYRCQVGVVMTNRHFTPGAKELAEATGVLLWDREKLEEMLKSYEE